MQRGNLLKRSGRLMVLASLALIALTALVGCAPRASSGALAATADESAVIIDLPALVIDVQNDGTTSIGDQPLADLGTQFGTDLSTLNVPPATVDYLRAGGIQHVQIDNSPEGILILVNGEPIPSLAWDGEKLVATGEVIETLGGGLPLLDKVLPLIANIGVGVIIRFPIAEGGEAIPLMVTDSAAADAALAAQEEFLAAVGTPPTFQLTVEYAEDGTWAVADITESEWSQLAPIPWEMLNMPATTIQAVSQAGVEEIGLATNADGIFISVNGNELPYITWADGRVQHLLDLAVDTGLMGQVLVTTDPTASQAIVDTVVGLLPAVQATDVSLRVTFP